MTNHLSKRAKEFPPSSPKGSPTSRRDSESSRFLDAFETDLLQEMDKTLKKMNQSEEAFEDDELCRKCEEMVEKGQLKRIEAFVEPASHCDHWDSKTRTCWFQRNIGDTVTFVLLTSNLNSMTPKVTWKKEFYDRHSNFRKEFVIEPVTSMWNIAIGRKDMELRLSPITESDVDFNRFSATVQEGDTLPQTASSKVNFQIQIVPIDLGFVYLGETLALSMERFCGLPYEGISYQWLLENDRDYSTLPSNMKISPSGSCVTISELRKDQEGVISCASYTGFGAFVAKRRFLVRDISEHNDISLAVLNLQQHDDLVHGHGHTKSKRTRNRTFPTEIKELDEDLENQFGNVRRSAPTRNLEISDDENRDSLKISESGNQPESDQGQSQLIETRNQLNRDFPKRVLPDSRRFPHNHVDEISRPRLIPNQSDRDFPEIRVVDDNQQFSKSNMTGISQARTIPPRVSNLDQRRPTEVADVNLGEEGSKYMYMRQSEIPVSKVRVTEGNYFRESVTRQHEEPKAKSNAKQEQTKVTAFDIERKVYDEAQVEDKVSTFMAPCSKDRHCSGHALCVKAKNVEAGVCRCLPGYNGDGIFCDNEVIL